MPVVSLFCAFSVASLLEGRDAKNERSGAATAQQQ